MQIEFPQFESRVVPARGAEPDHFGHRRSGAEAAVFQLDAARARAAEQVMLTLNVSAVRQASLDLEAGLLETDAAFQAAADALLRRGI